jgi:(E)-4-hydroxy-3-methylbut-2-enyl-diphosphate synthase
VYVDGEKTVTLKGETIARDFKRIVEDYVVARYGRGGGDSAANAA